MLEAIKKLFQNTSGITSDHASSNALAEYYQSRLQTSRSAVEIEAIFSMNEFMSFSELEKQLRGEVK
ncbi:hypothetical protein [Moritella sp. Urea-trap-13]|uniref:hypothetical protein n=1 Tax=Moritella sp. Urea-trap-13 TaxID=2058327 RepID=UPI000C34E29A|nr:hypothetical protein [Moritella sp. Urea-trap-13]PKH07854.1 hypothetical protein CXF93_03945 [Moritella sp. Urea-trap-13]